MKNCILFEMILIIAFSFNIYPQKVNLATAKSKMESTQLTHQTKSVIKPKSAKTVKYYHVEENINMKFGGHTITYDVSDLSLVNTNDLGPNNTRVVTARFTKENQLADYQTETITDTLKPVLEPILVPTIKPLDPVLKISDSITPANTNKSGDYAYITMIETYERVAEKGYKSIDIFKKLGDAYYFKGELGKAAKWYGELFIMTSDLDIEYYYRYSRSLKSIGQIDKGNTIMEKFKQKPEITKKIQ